MTPPASTTDDACEARRRAEEDEATLLAAAEHHSRRLLGVLGTLAMARKRLGAAATAWAPPRALLQRLAAFGGTLS